MLSPNVASSRRSHSEAWAGCMVAESTPTRSSSNSSNSPKSASFRSFSESAPRVFAALWAEGNEYEKRLQKVVGHVRYEKTANRFVHPSDESMPEAIRRFGNS